MNFKFIQIITICIIFKIILVCADVEPLKSPDELDPIKNSDNSEDTEKETEKEKRTILNPTIKNGAWARHIAVKPSGAKFLLGYGPVDFKYKPILRPIAIKHQGYHYNKPRIQFHIKRPIIHIPQVKPVLHAEWKPVIKPAVSIAKPVSVPVAIPTEPHVDQIHLNPVPHVDHIHKEPVHVTHVDHIHQIPAPVPVQHVHAVPHLHEIHQIPAPLPVQHVHAVPHLHQIPAPLPVQHVHTVPHLHEVPHVHVTPSPPPAVQVPFVPSAQLFEVTKPDLGVLPLGAVFPTTALKEIPSPQLNPVVVQHPVVPAPPPAVLQPVTPAPHVHEVHPVTHLHPVTPQPVAHAYPVPSPVPVTHLHPVGVEPVQVNTISHFQTPGHVFPINNFPSLDHFHHLNHVHSAGHIQPVEHVQHIPPLGHYQPVESVYPVEPHLHHAHPVGRFPPVENVHVSHPGSVGHIHPTVQTLPAPPLTTQVDYPEQPPVQSFLPNHYHLQYPQIPQYPNPPQDISNVGQNFIPNQQQPHFLDAGQNVFQQQLPHQQPSFQPEPNVQDQYPYQDDNRYQPDDNRYPPNDNPYQPNDNRYQPNDNRYQPANEVSSQHFIREGQFQIGDQNDDQGYVYPHPSQGRFIQPGQTDVQFPIQLPHHPNFNRIDQDSRAEASQQNDVFKPSIQLEPPYKK